MNLTKIQNYDILNIEEFGGNFMAKLGIVHCRVCGKEINRSILTEGIDWVMPSRNYFYHKECFDTWCAKKKGIKDVTADLDDSEYLENIKYYLTKDLKVSVNFAKLASQIKSFQAQGMTLKGILFSLIYFYDIKKHSVNKSNGGIGIVPFIYEEAKDYWIEQNTKQYNILDKIEEQMKQLRERPTVTVVIKDTPRKIKSYLDELGDSEDDE